MSDKMLSFFRNEFFPYFNIDGEQAEQNPDFNNIIELLNALVSRYSCPNQGEVCKKKNDEVIEGVSISSFICGDLDKIQTPSLICPNCSLATLEGSKDGYKITAILSCDGDTEILYKDILYTNSAEFPIDLENAIKIGNTKSVTILKEPSPCITYHLENEDCEFNVSLWCADDKNCLLSAEALKKKMVDDINNIIECLNSKISDESDEISSILTPNNDVVEIKPVDAEDFNFMPQEVITFDAPTEEVSNQYAFIKGIDDDEKLKVLKITEDDFVLQTIDGCVEISVPISTVYDFYYIFDTNGNIIREPNALFHLVVDDIM